MAVRLRRHAEDDDVDAEKWVLLQRLPFWRPTVVYKSFVSGHGFFCPPCIACLNSLSILPGFFFFCWFPGGQVEQ